MGGGGGGGWNRLGDVKSLEEKAKEALKGGRRNVFISFAAEDLDEVNLLRGQAKNENSDIEFNDHSVREPYDSERAEYIKARITERITRASITVVYLSEDTAKSPWVRWEVQESLRLGKTVVATHKGESFVGPMPEWIRTSRIEVVPWAELPPKLK